jgi:hypothetical protein
MNRDPTSRLHGRIPGERPCSAQGCREVGEFRAPNLTGRAAGFDGPGDYQWLCLDHVRAFNARYDYFAGMSAEEIEAAQSPAAGWANESRSFATTGADRPPKWSDFNDPLEAISARFKSGLPEQRQDGRPVSAADRAALKTLGLDVDADRKTIRARYTALARQYHPDRNGGDRSFEKKLQAVIDAYQTLRGSGSFS